MAQEDFTAVAIAGFHDRMLHQVGWPKRGSEEASGTPIWQWVAENHCCNSLLWREEDQARRTDVEPGVIAACKRRIDRYNQQRNDAVEALDAALLARIGPVQGHGEARLHSETVGAMVDRLSILALKIFHMAAQAERRDAAPEHLHACAAKRDRLALQRCDLADCLDRLLADVKAGRAYFKLYRQFKMYNDPTLNPYLNGQVRS